MLLLPGDIPLVIGQLTQSDLMRLACSTAKGEIKTLGEGGGVCAEREFGPISPCPLAKGHTQVTGVITGSSNG